MELEKDLMYGRGAWLYKQLERELAWERKREKVLNDFVAISMVLNRWRANRKIEKISETTWRKV